jgi:hypothetical protein
MTLLFATSRITDATRTVAFSKPIGKTGRLRAHPAPSSLRFSSDKIVLAAQSRSLPDEIHKAIDVKFDPSIDSHHGLIDKASKVFERHTHSLDRAAAQALLPIIHAHIDALPKSSTDKRLQATADKLHWMRMTAETLARPPEIIRAADF